MSETNRRRAASSRLEIIIGWLLGLICLVAFLACPNVRENTGDALGWARYIEKYASAPGTVLWATAEREPDGRGGRLARLSEAELAALGQRQREPGWWMMWNPHHLLFVPVTATVFRLVRHAIPPLGGMTFLQWWNALASAATIFLLYRLLVRIAPGSPYPLAWCLFLATSVTFFHYATDGTQYLTPVLFLTIAAGGLWAFGRDPRPAFLWRAGAWLALAVLFHQIVSLIVPFIAIGVWLLLRGKRRGGEGVSPAWAWGLLGIGLGVPVLVYLVVAAFALGPTGEFTLAGLLKYATLYGRQPGYWTDSVWRGLGVNLITFVGFYFGNPRTQPLLFVNPWFTVLAMVPVALWLITALRLRNVTREVRWTLICCALWVLPLLLFLSVWVPGHEFYHLFLIVPLACWAVVGAEASRKVGVRGWVEVALYWGWCVIAIIVNLPLSLSGCAWVGG